MVRAALPLPDPSLPCFALTLRPRAASAPPIPRAVLFAPTPRHPSAPQVDALTSCSVQALYCGGFATGLFLAPAVFFKGGASSYWDVPLVPDSATEWFANAFGVALGGIAIMNALADERSVDLCVTVNFLTNAASSAIFYKALSNRDAALPLWKAQNAVGLGMLGMSAMLYFK